MAILSRRGLKELLDEAPVEPDLLNRHFIRRLNALDDQSLATEWELIILSALSRVGLVEYEPDLDGSSNLDLRFTATSGLRFIGDVTYLSDEEAIRANPIESLADEIQRRRAKLGIKGELMIAGVSAHVGESRKTSLRIPLPHEFKKYVFDWKFTQFLKAVASSPTHAHSHSVDNDKAKLTVTYRPSAGHTTVMSYPDFRMPRDIEKNSLYGKLEAKRGQIRKIRHAPEDGLRGVVICDGGSTLFLQPQVGWGTFGFDQIARYFLKKTTSLDFVAAVAVKERRSRSGDDPGRYEFDVKVFDSGDGALDGIVGSVLREGLRNIPPPVRTPVNARLDLKGKRDRGLAELDFYDASGVTLSHGCLTMSARAVIDYLAGRIDRQRFEMITDSHSLGILKRDVEAGSLATSIRLSRRNDLDDDELEIRWGLPDETVSPFKARGND